MSKEGQIKIFKYKLKECEENKDVSRRSINGIVLKKDEWINFTHKVDKLDLFKNLIDCIESNNLVDHNNNNNNKIDIEELKKTHFINPVVIYDKVEVKEDIKDVEPINIDEKAKENIIPVVNFVNDAVCKNSSKIEQNTVELKIDLVKDSQFAELKIDPIKETELRELFKEKVKVTKQKKKIQIEQPNINIKVNYISDIKTIEEYKKMSEDELKEVIIKLDSSSKINLDNKSQQELLKILFDIKGV
jgi:Fe2+ transport system protein B